MVSSTGFCFYVITSEWKPCNMRLLFVKAFLELIRQHRFLHKQDLDGIHGGIRQTSVADRKPEHGDVERICRAVSIACIWYPKQVFCLQRSAAATKLLRRHGIPAEMVIGAKRLPLRAHAWVEVEGRVVNDKPEVQTDYLVMDRC
jgi:Transglutaminase-like superfamily